MEKPQVTDLRMKIAKVQSYLDLYNPTKFPPSVLAAQKAEWTAKVDSSYVEVNEALSNVLVLKLEDGEDYNAMVAELTEKVHVFTLEICTKVLSLAQPGLGGPPLASGTVSEAAAADRETRAACVSVEVDLEQLDALTDSLLAAIRKVEDAEELGDHDVQVAMLSLQTWRTQFKEIQDLMFSIKKKVKSSNLDERSLEAAVGAVSDLQSEMDTKIHDLIYEDEHRKLYSLAKDKSAKNLKYPSFHGQDGEDYFQFEREVKSTMKSNQVPRRDEVKVLRQCLHGDALDIVPKNLRCVEEAFSNLAKRFGDATRMMNIKMDALTTMGSYPKPGSKAAPHLRAQLKWLITLDQLLADMFELAKLSPDLWSEVYKPSTLISFKRLFPYKMCEAMMEQFTGDSVNKMACLQKYLKEKRISVQGILGDSAINTTHASASASHTHSADRIGIGGGYESDSSNAGVDSSYDSDEYWGMFD